MVHALRKLGVCQSVSFHDLRNDVINITGSSIMMTLVQCVKLEFHSKVRNGRALTLTESRGPSSKKMCVYPPFGRDTH